MIKVNELRQGNKVYFEGSLLTVTQIREYEALFIETAASVEYEDLDPIPLSPEILEACGFEKGTGDYARDSVVYSNGIRLYQHEENEYSLYGYNEQRVYVSFLHELQNLYYVLSGGTELPVNDNKFRKAEEKTL